MNFSRDFTFVKPWHSLEKSPASESAAFVAELQREIPATHPLAGIKVKAVARRFDCDEVLFKLEESAERHAVVYLTWSGRREFSPRWPHTELFESLEQFAENKMRPDAATLPPAPAGGQ